MPPTLFTRLGITERQRCSRAAAAALHTANRRRELDQFDSSWIHCKNVSTAGVMSVRGWMGVAQLGLQQELRRREYKGGLFRIEPDWSRLPLLLLLLLLVRFGAFRFVLGFTANAIPIKSLERVLMFSLARLLSCLIS